MAERRPGLVPPFGPLSGIRVLDTGRLVAGPWAATQLAEFGAEVIHVESPPFHRPYADATRSLPPLLPENGTLGAQVSESWIQYSRNKLSLGLDLRTLEGLRLFRKLLRRSQIWIDASRPGTFAKLHLSDRQILAITPRLVIVHVSGFGQTGDPSRIRRPSYDLIAQAYSGFLALQGDPEPAPPMRSGTALNDTVTGLATAGAALMGYVAALRTGRGQVVDVAQYEVFFSLLENLALDYFSRGKVRSRQGTSHPRLHPYDVVRAKDGWIVVAAPTPATWIRLRTTIGLPAGPWDDMEWRIAHRSEIDPKLSDFFTNRTVAELESLAVKADLAISGIPTIAELAKDPHYAAREMFLEWDDEVVGPVRGVGIAPKFSRTPGRVWRGAPWLGEDNRSILGQVLGLRPAEIDRLEERGVIGSDPPPFSSPASAPIHPREARR